MCLPSTERRCPSVLSELHKAQLNMPGGFKPVATDEDQADKSPEPSTQQPSGKQKSATRCPKPPSLHIPTIGLVVAGIVSWHGILYVLASRFLVPLAAECPKIDVVEKDIPLFPVSCDEIGATGTAVLSALKAAEPVWDPNAFSGLPYASVSVRDAMSFLTGSALEFERATDGHASHHLLANMPTDNSGNTEQLMDAIGGDSICLDARIDLISFPLGNSSAGCERRNMTIGVFAVVGTRHLSRSLVQSLRDHAATPGFHLPCAANDKAALLTALQFLASKDPGTFGEGWVCPQQIAPCARRVPGQLTVVRVWVERKKRLDSKLQ